MHVADHGPYYLNFDGKIYQSAAAALAGERRS
jgi:hypothetical protein